MSAADDFRREYLGTWDHSAKPSPGPWSWRETTQPSPYAPSGRERVFVVLDADGKCVAECERADDAEFIVRNGPAPAERQGVAVEKPRGRAR